MSTTHPTNITTEWDDLQRKHGNLPALEVEETNEVRDARLVEVAERELLREARLQAWKRRMQSRVRATFGAPVAITEESFVREVTDASKALCSASSDGLDDREGGKDPRGGGDEAAGPAADPGQPDLLATAGQYIPVLLLDERQDAPYLRRAWHELARRHPCVKFTVGAVHRILRCEGRNASAPSSLLLYFGGRCVMQKATASILQTMTYDLTDSSVECRIANALEAVLNSVSGHGPFLCGRESRASSPSGSDSADSEDGERAALRSAGKSFQRDFLSKLAGGRARRDSDSDSESDREGNSKTHTSWVFDRAFK